MRRHFICICNGTFLIVVISWFISLIPSQCLCLCFFSFFWIALLTSPLLSAVFLQMRFDRRTSRLCFLLLRLRLNFVWALFVWWSFFATVWSSSSPAFCSAAPIPTLLSSWNTRGFTSTVGILASTSPVFVVAFSLLFWFSQIATFTYCIVLFCFSGLLTVFVCAFCFISILTSRSPLDFMTFLFRFKIVGPVIDIFQRHYRPFVLVGFQHRLPSETYKISCWNFSLQDKRSS